MKTQILNLAAVVAAVIGLSACTGQVIPQTATTPDQAAAVSLEMHKQEVKRYDCSGNVTSDQIEVVQSPTELMELHPNRPSWTYDNISTSTFTDAQTGSSAGLIISNVKFTIDHGNGYLNMRVVDGINEIRYRFIFTDGYVEAASRFINVSYKETLLSGYSSIYPSAQECPPTSPK